MLRIELIERKKKKVRTRSLETTIACDNRVVSIVISISARKIYFSSLNKFFKKSVYERLKGNDFFGYFYNEGVVIKESRIKIDKILAIDKFKEHEEKYTEIFINTFKQYNSWVRKYNRWVEKHNGADPINKKEKKSEIILDQESIYSVGICIVSVRTETGRIMTIKTVSLRITHQIVRDCLTMFY